MLRSRFSAALYLVLVFLSGALLGGFAYRLYSANTVSATAGRRPDPVEWRKRYMDEMQTRVHTDAGQDAQINHILDETRAAFDQIREQEKQKYQDEQNAQIAKIFQLLRPDQRPLYAKLRAEREARRKAQATKK
jgi:Spy/CpxP family protein refolding chaperone